MGRKPKQESLDTILDRTVRDALTEGYDKDADKLKAISLGIDWVKVKHKIDEGAQAGQGLLDEEDEE